MSGFFRVQFVSLHTWDLVFSNDEPLIWKFHDYPISFYTIRVVSGSSNMSQSSIKTDTKFFAIKEWTISLCDNTTLLVISRNASGIYHFAWDDEVHNYI